MQTTSTKQYRPNVLAVFFRAISLCEWCQTMPKPLSPASKCPTPSDHVLLLVGMRSDQRGWQFPQGGIDTPTDSSPQDALIREVREELGIVYPRDYKIHHMLPDPIYYDFDPENQNTHLKAFRGQEQHWFACSLNSDQLPDLAEATDNEFSALKWVSPREALESIVPFKRQAYLRGLTELGFL